MQNENKAGDYTLISELSEGTSANVWKAQKDGKLYAIKLYKKGFESRAKEEFALMQRLEHPNIIDEYEIGIKDIRVYMVMDLLEGIPMDEADVNKYSMRDIEKMALQLAESLKYTHTLNPVVIHKDLKPANIFILNKKIKTLDFGESTTINYNPNEKLVKGSYSYMSPEQLIGETNKQNDIWSFGVTLYKFLTGTHPYQSETIEELSEKMLLLEMDFPHHVNPQISAKLSYVIMRCLRKNKAEHYNDFEDVIEDLAGSPLRKAKFKKFKRNTFLWGIRLLIFLVIMIVLILVLTKISSLFDVVIIDNFDSVGIGPLLFGVVFYFFVVILLIRWRKKIGKKIILKNFIESGSVVKESKFIK